MANTIKQLVEKLNDIKSRSQMRGFLKSFVGDPEDISSYLISELNKESKHPKETKRCEQLEKLIEEYYKFFNNEKDGEFILSQVYETKHREIALSIKNFIEKYGRLPVVNELANASRFSDNSIIQHFRSGGDTVYNSLVEGRISYMKTHALEKLYVLGISEGNSVALKLFIELSEKYKRNNEAERNHKLNFSQTGKGYITDEELKRIPENWDIKLKII